MDLLLGPLRIGTFFLGDPLWIGWSIWPGHAGESEREMEEAYPIELVAFDGQKVKRLLLSVYMEWILVYPSFVFLTLIFSTCACLELAYSITFRQD